MTNAKLEQAVASVALSRAHAAAARGDDTEALERLLEAWAAVHDRELADRIDIVSHRAALLRPPVTDETQWLTRTRDADAVELGRLLAKLPRRRSLLIPGFQALLDRPPDPRLASACMRLRHRLRGHLWTNPSARLPVLRHLDPAYWPTLRALQSANGEQPDLMIDAALDAHEAFVRVRATKLDARGLAWLRAFDDLARAPDRELGVEFWAGFGVRGELVGLDGARVIDPREAQWLETHPGLATFQRLGGAPASLAESLSLRT